MPHPNHQLGTNDSTVADRICHYLYQTLVSLQKRNPEWLSPRYRNVPWHQPHYQSIFLGKMSQRLSQVKPPEKLFAKVQDDLKALLSTEFIQTSQYRDLVTQFEQLIYPNPKLTPFPHPSEIYPQQLYFNGRSFSTNGISILLLDVENLQLDVETEKFLETICTCPLQIKVAFANWRSMGKKDVEFHHRGYQLIHVPPGKDSADLKMATVGSSIFVYYPTAQEVLVCSSDRALTHLCNTLQGHGLTVYQVKKKKDQIVVINNHTGEIQQFALKSSNDIPSLDELIVQLKDLIRAEQKRIQTQWIKLSRLSALYKDTYNLTISQVVSAHSAEAKARDIFIKNPQVFAIHQPSEKSQTYVTLFELAAVKEKPVPASENSTENSNNSNNGSVKIESIEQLEVALVEIVKELTAKTASPCISLSILGSYFNKKYGQAITQVIKQFQPGGKFPKFIDLCNSFGLEKTERGWNVCLLPATPSSSTPE
ncbi:MAG: hypothetical protein AAFO04_17065 [Cyanobacteria bacterium J06592_8]